MYEANEVNKESVDTAPKKVVTKEEKPKKRFKWKKFLGFCLLGLFVLGIGYIGYRFYTFTPYRVIVSNVTSRSATISWVTDSAEPGMVVFKEEKTLLPIWVSKYGLGNGFDDRDYTTAELLAAEKTQENIAESEGITAGDIETEIVVTSLGKYWSHHVTVRNLEPETGYEFLVGDGLVFEKANTVDTEVSKLTTLKEQESIDTPMPAYGIVRYYYEEDSEGPVFLRANDAVVYTYLRDEVSEIESKSLSSTMNDEGGWYLDLTSANTSEGENFFDALGSAETTDVNLYFTVEGVGFGRWTIIKNLEDIAPSDSFDLVDPEDEDDSDLDFQGYSFGAEDDSLVSSLVTKINAKLPPGEEAAKAAYEAYIKENTGQAPGTTAYGGSSTEGVGTCRGDVCGAGGQCGWVNDLDCRCVCDGETIDIAPGTTCNCNSDKKAFATGEEEVALSESAASLWGGGALCSNNNGATTKNCWSATNGCWYGANHTAQNGLVCDPTGRWGDPEYKITSYPVKANEDPVIDPEKEIPAGGNISSCWVGRGRGFWTTETKAMLIGNYLIQDTSLNEEECLASTGTRGAVNANNGESIAGTGCYENDETGHNLVTIQDEVVYKCSNGEWKKAFNQSPAEDTITTGGDCTNFYNWDRTVIDGKIYECAMIGGGFEWKLHTKTTQEYALKIKTNKKNGYTCMDTDDYDKCLCTYTSYIEYDYCDSEYTPRYPGVNCKGFVPKVNELLIDPNVTCPADEKRPSASILGIEKSNVLANTQNQEKYILDTETSMIQGFKPGLYSFEYNGDTYMINVSEEDYAYNKGNFTIYLDKNGDGEIDELTEVLTDEAVILTLQAEKEGFVYTLKQGFNFVSFPFVISEGDVKMASELLELLNYKYDNSFYSISKYDSGKWKMVGSNGGTYNQNDFQIIPGEGYVLKTKWDLNITLYGNEVTYESSTDSAPIRFTPGWNLVGLYGSNVKSYTAESILTDITNYQNTDFTAVNVSRWVENRALYEALQRDEDNTVYGLDFPIELKKGYFIKVTKGEGNWEPGID